MTLPAETIASLNERGIGHCYDRHGNPIGMGDMLNLKADGDYFRVALDQIDDAQISTVWLGVDQNFGSGSRLQLFETMISGGDHGGVIERYATEEEAVAGHRKIVERLRSSLR